MEKEVDRKTIARANECQTIPPTMFRNHFSKMDIGTKLRSCVQRLVIPPKLQDVRQLLGNDMTSQQFTLDDVKMHSDSDSCWIVLHDKVYDVTEFLSSHPGGIEIILENAGSDATTPFESKGHSADACSMLDQYCIGALVQKDRRS